MKIDRMISIVMLLLERPRVQASELAEMFQVSTRTIYRDIDALGLAGLPVVTYPGGGGGVALMEQYKLDKRLLTATDIAVLLIGLDSLKTSLPGQEIAPTLAKLKGLLPQHQEQDIADRAQQIIIDPTSWGNSSMLKPLFEEIRRAIEQRQRIRFRYLPPDGHEQEREVEPYCLMNKSLNWYVQGFCQERQDFRTFKLTRIAALQTLEETFLPRPFTPRVFDADGWGNGPTLKITLRLHRSLRSGMEEWTGRDQLIADGPEHYLAYFSFPYSPWVDRFVLGWGPRCEVLEPLQLREHIAELTAAMAALYT